MTRPDKLTPVNIKEHISESATEHRGFGWKMFTLLYDLNINDTAAGRLMNCHPRTMKKWREIEALRRSQRRDADNEAVRSLKD